MESLPLRSGSATSTRRSNLPGRNRAASRMSGRLVAAMTITLWLASKPALSPTSACMVLLAQQLVECLLALVVAADAHTAGSLPADGVDLVHEDDARRNLLRLVEKVANSSGTDADEHLHELGGADREEGDLGLSCDG